MGTDEKSATSPAQQPPATVERVQQALLNEIMSRVAGQDPKGLLLLAETLAWIRIPAASHGGPV